MFMNLQGHTLAAVLNLWNEKVRGPLAIRVGLKLSALRE